MRRELRAVATQHTERGRRWRPRVRTWASVAPLCVGMTVLAGSTWAIGPVGGIVVTLGALASGLLFSMAFAPDDQVIDARSRLEQELERARRFGHALTLVRVPGAGPESESFVRHPSARTGLARRIDQAWIEGDDLYLTLYDTGAHGAALVIDRLRSFGIASDDTQIAVFPESALTAGELRRQVNVAAANGEVPFTGVSIDSTHEHGRPRVVADLPPTAAR